MELPGRLMSLNRNRDLEERTGAAIAAFQQVARPDREEQGCVYYRILVGIRPGRPQPATQAQGLPALRQAPHRSRDGPTLICHGF